MNAPDPREPDPRFPSGPWRGYWEQGLLRGWMTLDLTFTGGHLRGHGHDCVGAFVMHGRYDTATGQFTVQKQFVGQHLVSYQGQAGPRALLGRWSMAMNDAQDGGPFRLWPLAHDDHERAALAAAKPEIVTVNRRAEGVLVG